MNTKLEQFLPARGARCGCWSVWRPFFPILAAIILSTTVLGFLSFWLPSVKDVMRWTEVPSEGNKGFRATAREEALLLRASARALNDAKVTNGFLWYPIRSFSEVQPANAGTSGPSASKAAGAQASIPPQTSRERAAAIRRIIWASQVPLTHCLVLGPEEPFRITPLAAQQPQVHLLRGQRQLGWDSLPAYGLLVGDPNGNSFLLTLELLPLPERLQARAFSSKEQAGARRWEPTTLDLLLAAESPLAPSAFGWISGASVRYRETACASAFLRMIQDENRARGKALIELSEQDAPAFERLVGDLLLVATGSVEAADALAGPAAASLDVKGLAERLEWRTRLFGSDTWGLIQFACITFFFLAVVIGIGRARYPGALPDWSQRWTLFSLEQSVALAFLGTVIGVSMAVGAAYLATSPDRLLKDQAIAKITMALKLSFDTTFVGLITLVAGQIVLQITERFEK